MPSYSFICLQCGEHFEKILPLDGDQSQVICPKGHTQAERVYAAPQVVFKGNGYYVTDNRSKTKDSSITE